jgi:hypothetical protein
MYTTIKGNALELNKAGWPKIRKCALKRFEGSKRLFEACWKQYRNYVKSSIDNPESISDVMDWLNNIASEKVNNPNSQFYIYG